MAPLRLDPLANAPPDLGFSFRIRVYGVGLRFRDLGPLRGYANSELGVMENELEKGQKLGNWAAKSFLEVATVFRKNHLGGCQKLNTFLGPPWEYLPPNT